MRTKDEYLTDAKTYMPGKTSNYTKLYGLRYLELEVLIDIRDILDNRLREINSDIYKLAQKD